ATNPGGEGVPDATTHKSGGGEIDDRSSRDAEQAPFGSGCGFGIGSTAGHGGIRVWKSGGRRQPADGRAGRTHSPALLAASPRLAVRNLQNLRTLQAVGAARVRPLIRA